MREITKGHYYELANMEGSTPGQLIQFIQKVPALHADAGGMVTEVDGTTNEEVLRMLIHRMNYLQDKFPCRENDIVIEKLEESLMWLEKRTSDRKARNVEGKAIA